MGAAGGRSEDRTLGESATGAGATGFVRLRYNPAKSHPPQPQDEARPRPLDRESPCPRRFETERPWTFATADRNWDQRPPVPEQADRPANHSGRMPAVDLARKSGHWRCTDLLYVATGYPQTEHPKLPTLARGKSAIADTPVDRPPTTASGQATTDGSNPGCLRSVAASGSFLWHDQRQSPGSGCSPAATDQSRPPTSVVRPSPCQMP